MSDLSGHTPKRNFSPEEAEQVESFISGAEQETGADEAEEDSSSSSSAERYPWNEPHVRPDVKQSYPLRMKEPLYLKLKYVSKQTGRSMNEICNEAVRRAVEEELNRIA